MDLRLTRPDLYAHARMALDHLAERGPTLGRPLADRIHGSAIHHLKELRVTSQRDHSLRVLYAFDSRRQAVLLFAGDKAGDWNDWYPSAIREAELNFAQHERGLMSDE